MLYLKVLWSSKQENHPSIIYKEIDADGWEVRKVEIFRDGHSTFADLSSDAGKSMLSDQKLEIGRIRQSGTLRFNEISREEFEQVWSERDETQAP